MRHLLVFAMWITLAVVGLVIFLGVFTTRNPADNTEKNLLPVDPTTHRRAQTKLEAFEAQSEQARSSGKKLPAQISFTDEEMTALIRNWGNQDHWFGSVNDLQIELVPGTFVITGTLQSISLNFPFRLELAISAENNRRRAELTLLQVGELFAPGFVRAAMLALADRTFDAGLPRVALSIESLVVTNGELIVSGNVLP